MKLMDRKPVNDFITFLKFYEEILYHLCETDQCVHRNGSWWLVWCDHSHFFWCQCHNSVSASFWASSLSGMDKVREGGTMFTGNDKKNLGINNNISVNGIQREIFSFKLYSWGRKHFVHPWSFSSFLYHQQSILLSLSWLLLLSSSF